MDRRKFLGALVGGLFTAAEIAKDPEKLLWTPKLISIPKAPPTDPLVMTIDEFSERYIQPAAQYIAEQIDNVGLTDVYSGNILLTVNMITKEALEVLRNNLQMESYFHRNYDLDFISGDQWKVGDIIRVRKPPKYRLT